MVWVMVTSLQFEKLYRGYNKICIGPGRLALKLKILKYNFWLTIALILFNLSKLQGWCCPAFSLCTFNQTHDM